MGVIRYQHHGEEMAVQEHLKGKHREHCLCFKCGKFFPDDRQKNCVIANVLYNIDISLNLVTPVWECGAFEDIP